MLWLIGGNGMSRWEAPVKAEAMVMDKITKEKAVIIIIRQIQDLGQLLFSELGRINK